MYIWDSETGAMKHNLQVHTDQSFVLHANPTDPRLVLSAGYDGKLIILDVETGFPVSSFFGNNNPHETTNTTDDLELVDGQWAPDGSSLVVSDMYGRFSFYGTSDGSNMNRAKFDQFFSSDYNTLVRDQAGNVVDGVSQLPPWESSGSDLLCDYMLTPYPDPYQQAFRDGTVLLHCPEEENSTPIQAVYVDQVN